MSNPAFPVDASLPPAGLEALRQTVEDGLAARKCEATASEISRLLKTLERLQPAAINVPPTETEAFAASGTALFNAALRAAA